MVPSSAAQASLQGSGPNNRRKPQIKANFMLVLIAKQSFIVSPFWQEPKAKCRANRVSSCDCRTIRRLSSAVQLRFRCCTSCHDLLILLHPIELPLDGLDRLAEIAA